MKKKIKSQASKVKRGRKREVERAPWGCERRCGRLGERARREQEEEELKEAESSKEKKTQGKKMI